MYFPNFYLKIIVHAIIDSNIDSVKCKGNVYNILFLLKATVVIFDIQCNTYI